jgi:SseB protein N-terminal domain
MRCSAVTDDHDARPGGAETALRLLAEGGDEQAALGALAFADVLLPEVGEPPDGADESSVLQLPVARQDDGTQVVPVFSSEARLTDALPGVSRYRSVRMAALARVWPSDDLMLIIDPGTDTGITMPAEGVRALAALSG